ncbi:hypothetical protein EYA82_01595 [Burkholderia pseudomallei]|nr:hypothetical protein EYA82_01595 [Burkholderia pseudomallei]
MASERGNGNGNDTTRHGSDHDLTNRNGRQSMRTGQPRAEPRSGAAPMGSRARRRMHGCDGIFVRGARSPRFGVPPARLRLAIGFDGRTSVSHPPPRQASDRDEPADEVRRLGRAIRRYIGDVDARRWARHRRTRISRAPRDPAIAAAPGVHRGEAAAPSAQRRATVHGRCRTGRRKIARRRPLDGRRVTAGHARAARRNTSVIRRRQRNGRGRASAVPTPSGDRPASLAAIMPADRGGYGHRRRLGATRHARAHAGSAIPPRHAPSPRRRLRRRQRSAADQADLRDVRLAHPLHLGMAGLVRIVGVERQMRRREKIFNLLKQREDEAHLRLLSANVQGFPLERILGVFPKSS